MIEDKRLTDVIKEQAQMFLLNAGEFFPFGSCVDKNDKIKPLGAFLEGDSPSSLELINMLEKHIKEGLSNGDYKIGALAVDVTIKQDGISFDAVEIRYFKQNEDVYKKHLKYALKGSHVEFS